MYERMTSSTKRMQMGMNANSRRNAIVILKDVDLNMMFAA